MGKKERTDSHMYELVAAQINFASKPYIITIILMWLLLSDRSSKTKLR
jgi:hypothetical protein